MRMIKGRRRAGSHLTGLYFFFRLLKKCIISKVYVPQQKLVQIKIDYYSYIHKPIFVYSLLIERKSRYVYRHFKNQAMALNTFEVRSSESPHCN